MSDLLPDSIMYWTFINLTKADAYLGYTVYDSAVLSSVPVGTEFESPFGDEYGFYVVTNVVNYPVDLSAHHRVGYYNEGANVVYSYFDASSLSYLPTQYGAQGIPGSYTGLGGGFDYASTP